MPTITREADRTPWWMEEWSCPKCGACWGISRSDFEDAEVDVLQSDEGIAGVAMHCPHCYEMVLRTSTSQRVSKGIDRG